MSHVWKAMVSAQTHDSCVDKDATAEAQTIVLKAKSKTAAEIKAALAYFKEPEPVRPRKPALDTLQAMAEASQKSHLLCGAFSFYGSTEDDKDLTAWATPKP